MIEESTEDQSATTREVVALEEYLHMDQVVAGSATNFSTTNQDLHNSKQVKLGSLGLHTVPPSSPTTAPNVHLGYTGMMLQEVIYPLQEPQD